LGKYLRLRTGLLNESVILTIFIQICFGLEYIHKRRIIHRDIKTDNIFLNENLEVRIGDFGIAKSLNKNIEYANSIIGTPYYLSPELLNGNPYNEKNDIWALGCLLYEMCKKTQPFKSEKTINLRKKINIGKSFKST
jgi:NIMA (never in mitosis gene a)-related kinase